MCTCVCTSLLPLGTFPCGRVWPGQKGEERVGMNPLVSGHKEGDLEEYADPVGDHGCLLLGTNLVPRVSAVSALLSRQLKDVSLAVAKGKTCEAVVTGVFSPWTEHGEAVTCPTTPGVQEPWGRVSLERRQRDCPGKPVSVRHSPAAPSSLWAEHRHSCLRGQTEACTIARVLRSMDITWTRRET